MAGFVYKNALVRLTDAPVVSGGFVRMTLNAGPDVNVEVSSERAEPLPTPRDNPHKPGTPEFDEWTRELCELQTFDVGHPDYVRAHAHMSELIEARDAAYDRSSGVGAPSRAQRAVENEAWEAHHQHGPGRPRDTVITAADERALQHSADARDEEYTRRWKKAHVSASGYVTAVKELGGAVIDLRDAVVELQADRDYVVVGSGHLSVPFVVRNGAGHVVYSTDPGTPVDSVIDDDDDDDFIAAHSVVPDGTVDIQWTPGGFFRAT